MVRILEDSPIAIAPYFDGKHSSIIYTHQGSFRFVETVDEILECYCVMNGASMEGRLRAVRKKCGFRKNPPAFLYPLEIVALPLPGSCGEGTIWVMDLDFKIIKKESSCCRIVFSNNLEIPIALTMETIKLRRSRAFEVLHTFNHV